MGRWIIVLVLALLILIGGNVEASYRGPFEGWIVDANTKEPVEGVVVSIEWVQDHINSGGTHVETAETLTDEKGHFYIPGWWSFNPWKNFMTYALPTFFKSGYEPIVGGPWDAFLEIEWGAPKGTFIWKIQKGRPVILFHKASTDLEERRRSSGRVGTPEDGEKMKLLRKEMDKEHNLLFPKLNRIAADVKHV